MGLESVEGIAKKGEGGELGLGSGERERKDGQGIRVSGREYED